MKRYIRSASTPVGVKIANTAYGEDAVKYALQALYRNPDSYVDGYDTISSDTFEVSYQGDLDMLLTEINDIFKQAGVTLHQESDNTFVYDNDNQEVFINVYPDDSANTYTKDSYGYSISVTNTYE